MTLPKVNFKKVNMSFALLGLSPTLSSAAVALGFGTPTPIQAQCIPAILLGGDLIAQAQTGSGKTAAFALPLLDQISNLAAQSTKTEPRVAQVLVLAPTRELVAQIGAVFQQFAQASGSSCKIAIIFGGVSINPQMMALRGGAHCIIATPGRLLDLVKNNALHLNSIKTLVLDEADRMLDAAFADELNQVLALLPTKRQTLLFSATYAQNLQSLSERVTRKPLIVKVESDQAQANQTEPKILQRAIMVDAGKRTQLLIHLLKENQWEPALVFAATKYATTHIAEKLYQKGIYATALHGDLSQGARTKVLAELKNDQWQVVVTTDLASRGIDIPHLPIVFNYDLPRSTTDYTHRIGRTGRAGTAGVAISFVSAQTLAHWQLIEKRHAQKMKPEIIAGFEPTALPNNSDVTLNDWPHGALGVDQLNESPRAPDPNGGIKGKKPNKKDKLRAAQSVKPTTE
jgi:ATP-dependent RNA helicase RhlE